MKKILRLMAIGTFLFLVGWIFQTWQTSQQSEIFQRSILEKISAAKKTKGNLDLSSLYPDKWDELVVWLPYENICRLGIKGTFFKPLFCFELPSKGECDLLFLKENHLVAKVAVARQVLDFANVKLHHIPRSSAKFDGLNEKEFPKAILIFK